MGFRHFLLLTLLVGCKQSKADQCEELARLGVTVANELGKQLGGKEGMGDDPEIKQKMNELKQQCMQWPDEVFECMRKNDETSPKCAAAMEHVTGKISANAEKAPEGPAIVAKATLGDADWEGVPVALAKDGTLTAAPEKAIVAFDAAGNEKWRVELSHSRWLLALDNTILVSSREDKALVALDATGAVKWQVAIPVATDGDEYDDRNAEGAVRVGERVFVATADGRILKLAPTACAAKKQKGCLEPAFSLPDETFDNPQLLAMGDDIVVGEEGAIRLFSQTGELLASVHVRDTFGGIALAGEQRIAATFDDELVLFDLAQCNAKPAALPRKKGRMYIRGEGECEDCIVARSGCVVARSEIDDVENVVPTVLHDGSVMVSNFDGPARAAVNGNKHWNSEIDAVGPIREVGDTVVFVSRGDDSTPARLVALDTKTGKAKWQRAFPDVKSDDISYTSDPIVEVNGGWLVAGAKGRVAWMKLAM